MLRKKKSSRQVHKVTLVVSDVSDHKLLAKQERNSFCYDIQSRSCQFASGQLMQTPRFWKFCMSHLALFSSQGSNWRGHQALPLEDWFTDCKISLSRIILAVFSLHFHCQEHLLMFSLYLTFLKFLVYSRRISHK